MKKDTLFQNPGRRESPFSFDEEVASVFDDMLKRSIPFYYEIQSMIAELVDSFIPQSGKIYDLGCSTGTTIGLLDKSMQYKSVTFVGVDSSSAMLQRAAQNLAKLRVKKFELLQTDLNEGIDIIKADAVILNLVLQFIQPENREKLLQDIFTGLQKTGCLILIEKINSGNKLLDEVYTEAYYKFKKRNLYTDEEVASKRKALENILVPNQKSENITLLKNAGFSSIETFFCWFNFCGVIAIKE